MAKRTTNFRFWWVPGSIRGKIFWSFALLFGLGMAWLITVLQLNYLSQQSVQTYSEGLQPVKKNCQDAIYAGYHLLEELKAYVEDPSASATLRDKLIKDDLARFSSIQQLLRDSVSEDANMQLQFELPPIISGMEDFRNKALDILDNDNPDTGEIKAAVATLDRLETNTENIVSILNYKIEQAQAELLDRITLISYISVAFQAIITIVIIILIFYFIQILSRHFSRLYKVSNQLSEGNIPPAIPVEDDERHQISKNFNSFFQNLEKVRDFAKKVGDGEFDNAITVFDNQGQLGNSLNDMKVSLNEVAKADIQRMWVNEGFAKFGDILRSHNTIQALGDDLITQLVKYMGANQGAIFLKEERPNSGEEYLRTLSIYAYERKKFIDFEIEWGEGLVGRAWQENDTIFLTEVPESFINIRSGLGGAPPKCVLIQPLNYNEEMIGVMELASFEEFPEYRIEFIKKLGETIAATVISSFANEKTVTMLEDARQMTEEMKAQEEEMRQNMEELQATQEEMRRTQMEVKTKEANLSGVINSTDDTIFAVDTNYCILVVNNVLKNRFKKQGINLRPGDNVLDLLPNEQRLAWKARYDRALGGERFTKTEKSMSSGNLTWVETFHNPIYNNAGEVIGASVIGRDITAFITMQEEVKRKESVLKSIIDFTEDTYFAIDKESRITVVNKALRDRFASSNIELNEGDNIFDKLPEAQHDFWKGVYERAFKGESFSFTQERPVGEKTLFIEVKCNPVMDSTGEVIGASVMSHDITKLHEAVEEKARLEKENQKLKKELGDEG